jgi:hypothetical protein
MPATPFRTAPAAGPSFSSASTLARALVATACLGAPAAAQTIHVRAWIDGRSQLTLDGATARWHHDDFGAPGRLDCDIGQPIQPTFLDGVPWLPQWPDVPTCENRDCHCDSDTYAGLAPGLPDVAFTVLLTPIQCRGTCTIVEQPTLANGWRVRIEFNDNFFGAADWYEVQIQASEVAQVLSYCTSAPNSAGTAAIMGFLGSASIAANTARLQVSGAPSGHPGLFFCGMAPAQIPFADGTLCVSPLAPGLLRLMPPLNVGPGGAAERLLDFGALTQIDPGETWYFQFWFRDHPPGGSGSNLSDGMAVTFQP